jgi:predicted DNA-binding protein with PD1-like motif
MTQLIPYAFRLHPKQDLLEEIARFSTAHNFHAACILTCVGSLTHVNLRMANQPRSSSFTGHFEIVSLVGTLSQQGNHLHISLADSNGKTFGGHLMSDCLIYTTAEIVVGELQGIQFTRPIDSQTTYDELVVKYE